MHNEAVCQVGTLLTLLDGALAPAAAGGETLATAHYERIFLYCLTWSVGGLLPQSDRAAFDGHLRTLADDMPSKASLVLHKNPTRLYSRRSARKLDVYIFTEMSRSPCGWSCCTRA